METPSKHRPRFQNRPWITGKLYDDMARTSILHCDAYVLDAATGRYLMIDWREGGRDQKALDVYLIQDDGLTAMWDARVATGGRAMYWTSENHAWMRRVHARVLREAENILAMGTWSRVSVQAHYVLTRESDCEIPAGRNKYVDPKPYKPRTGSKGGTLPDIL